MRKGFLLVCVMVFVSAIGISVSSAHEGEAHLRVGHFVADGPTVDVWVNGERVLEAFEPRSLSDFWELDPGTVSVTIVPAGEDEDQAVVGPETIMAEGDHNYTVALVGQAADETVNAVVVDETTAMADCDMSKSVFRIIFNNIAGGPPVSFYEEGMFVEKNIAYGDYAATCVPVFSWDTGKMVVGEDLDNILFDFDSAEDGQSGFWDPYTVYLWGLMGSYPGAPDEDYFFGGGNWYVVTPDPLELLSAFSGAGLTYDSELYFEFDTFVDLVKQAGLDDMLLNEGPFTIFAPTDQAFEALPEGALDELRADPDALDAFLRNHIVEGALDAEALSAAETVTSLQGSEIAIGQPQAEDDFHFYLGDEARISNFWYPIANGSQVWLIDNLSTLTPAE